MKNFFAIVPGHIITLMIFLSLMACNKENRDWENAKNQNSIEIYKDFIAKYPESNYIVLASRLIDSIAWEEALLQNRLSSFKSYINEHPEGNFIDEAIAGIELIEFENAVQAKNIDSLLLYLNKYPESNNTDEIIKQVKILFSKEEVIYSYKTFWLMQVQDQETGDWVYPTYRTYYGEGFEDKSITANLNGNKYKCNLLYQDIATYKNRIKIPVFAYQGCPFSLEGVLKVEKDVKYDVPLTIIIESTKGNILWVSKESALPFLYNNGNLLSGYKTAINLTWLFPRSGDLFFAGNDVYLIKKDSAKIEFTSDGIKLKGISKL